MPVMIIISIWVGVYFPSYFLSTTYLFLPNGCRRDVIPRGMRTTTAEMSASLGCYQLSLAIGKHVFPTDLIVLKSQGLDIILGMDWLARYQGVIDCASWSISLSTPSGQKIRYVSKYKHQHAQVNSLKGGSLDDVRIVREYPDVFPEELPGMPPNREIEFLIDLIPGTGPIAKRPYRMPANELAELKEQIRELQEKGFIRPKLVTLGISSVVC